MLSDYWPSQRVRISAVVSLLCDLERVMDLVCFLVCKVQSRWWLQAILKAALWT